VNRSSGTALLRLFLLSASSTCGQSALLSPDRPWHGPGEKRIETDARGIPGSGFGLDPAKTYTLAELVNLAESHNPETRVAWERARAQAAALGIARSELYPTLAAEALAGVNRTEDYVVSRFYRQTIGDFQVALNLHYTIFDFGARSGRIAAASAASNFALWPPSKPISREHSNVSSRSSGVIPRETRGVRRHYNSRPFFS
jgi:outer membrane protein